MELRTPRFSCKLYDTMGRLLAAAYVSLIATSTIEAQTVLTVDDAPGPGVMYVGIQPAIDAAANGDILDIAPGSYSSFTIDGKSLTLVGSGSASTTVGGTTIVGNVPFGSRTTIHRMTLSKLQVGGTPLQSGDAVTTASFEEMSIDKVATVDAVRCDFSKSTMNQGLRVLNGDVVLSSCTVWMSLPGYGPPSLGIGSLNAAIYNGWDGSPGGPITIANTFVYGQNAAPIPYFPYFASPGLINNSAFAVRAFGPSTTIQGGLGAPVWGQPNLPNAAAIENYGGNVTLHAIAVVSSAANPIVGPVTISATHLPALWLSPGWNTSFSATLGLYLSGPNSAFAPYALGFDLATDRSTLPATFVGDFLLSSSAVLLDSGLLGQSGVKFLNFAGPSMPPDLVFVPMYVQIFTLNTATGVWSAGALMSGLLAP
jgi:hypothetical protein